MLNEIQKVEQEVREAIETAKHEAAQAILRAHTKVADAKVKLEEELRATEVAAIASAEAEARAQANTLLQEVTNKQSPGVSPQATILAHEILKPYLN